MLQTQTLLSSSASSNSALSLSQSTPYTSKPDDDDDEPGMMDDDDDEDVDEDGDEDMMGRKRRRRKRLDAINFGDDYQNSGLPQDFQEIPQGKTSRKRSTRGGGSTTRGGGKTKGGGGQTKGGGGKTKGGGGKTKGGGGKKKGKLSDYDRAMKRVMSYQHDEFGKDLIRVNNVDPDLQTTIGIVQSLREHNWAEVTDENRAAILFNVDWFGEFHRWSPRMIQPYFSETQSYYFKKHRIKYRLINSLEYKKGCVAHVHEISEKAGGATLDICASGLESAVRMVTKMVIKDTMTNFSGIGEYVYWRLGFREHHATDPPIGTTVYHC